MIAYPIITHPSAGPWNSAYPGWWRRSSPGRAEGQHRGAHRQAGIDQPGIRERADGLSRNVSIKLNDKDISRAKELLKYRWRMLAGGLKYELDALANKDFRYPTKTYLARKLKEEDWLD